MKYKVEILRGGVPNRVFILTKVTHPNQAIFKAVKTAGLLEYCVVAILNERGDRWLYLIKDSKAIVLKNDMQKYNKYDVDIIFSDNKNIYERREI